MSNATRQGGMMDEISTVLAGGLAVLEWNGEVVEVVSQSFSRTVIRSLAANGTREVSPGCPILAYEGNLSGSACACGCGRIVVGQRSTRIYATSACRIRVSKRNSRGNAKTGHSKVPGNANFVS